MESEDVLTDDMNVCRPVLLELLRLLLIGLIGIIAKGCDIVGKRIKPNVGYVLGIEGYGNTPCKGCTGNAKILKACLDRKSVV